MLIKTGDAHIEGVAEVVGIKFAPGWMHAIAPRGHYKRPTVLWADCCYRDDSIYQFRPTGGE